MNKKKNVLSTHSTEMFWVCQVLAYITVDNQWTQEMKVLTDKVYILMGENGKHIHA